MKAWECIGLQRERIEQLEDKVDLLLSHLDLAYRSEIIERSRLVPFKDLFVDHYQVKKGSKHK